MKEILDQFLHFLQQGIAAIFRFTQVPWESWPLWKQILLIVVIVAVAYALFFAARPLWAAAVRVLAAFVGFLGALVYTLPAILIAGCIALAGLWTLNNFNPDSLPKITVFERGNTGSSNDGNRPPAQTNQPRETTGSGQ
jgi:hypothetical protein